MKKNFLFYSLFIAVLAVGCTKDDGPVRGDIGIDRVAQPKVIRNGGSTSISMANLTAFEGKFDVMLHYPNDIVSAPRMDVVVRKNNSNSNVKLFKEGITVFPTTVTINAAQLAALFSAPIVLNDTYDISVDVYAQSGTKYEAWPAFGAPYGSTGMIGTATGGQPGFSVVVTYKAVP
jgi:hypothetical protein